MVANSWVSTWPQSALRAAGLEPTPFTVKVLQLWNKSTPTQPWTVNPIGIPAKGYTRRVVPQTSYALFNTYRDFSAAFAKALETPAGKTLRIHLESGESIAKLWRTIHEFGWPGADTESDYPALIHEWIGDQYRDMLNIPSAPVRKSSGATAQTHLNNHRVMEAHRLMITAAQTKLDLSTAIKFITKGVK